MSDHDRTRLGAADTTEPGAGDTVDEGSGHHEPPPPRPRGPGLLVAIALGLAVALGGAFYFLQDPGPAPPIVKPPPPVPPAEKSLDELRARARTCLEGAPESPDWDGCEAAVKAALDQNPIDEDANTLAKRLSAERTAHDAFTRGAQAIGFNRVEDGFELLEKIPHDSSYFPKAYELVRRELPAATKTWAERCKKYASGNKWPQAELDCGWLLRTSCAQMPHDAWQPPPLQTLCAKPNAKGCWTPKDENVARLFQARAKTDPRAGPWVCPKTPLYVEHKPVVPPKVAPATLGDPALDKAAALYRNGNVNDAITQLQKLQERTENAGLHARARGLQRDIAAIDGLVKQGQTQLAQGKLDLAAKAFDEALELDKTFSAGAEPSALRKQMQADMGEASLTRGGPLLERGDLRTGCKLLKLGYRFNRANVDLLTVINKCSEAAAGTLAAAKDCPGADAALELAVDGDGIREKAAAKKTELGCP